MARQKPYKFLPFDKYHVAPIGGIDPDSLKNAAKLARTKYRDDERKLSHSLVLHRIAKSLAFAEVGADISATTRSRWTGSCGSMASFPGLTFSLPFPLSGMPSFS